MEQIKENIQNLKILWFTMTPSLYDQGTHQYNGCGWIESLEMLIADQKQIDLAVSFFHKTDDEKSFKNGTTYYPILQKRNRKNPLRSLINNWQGIDGIKDYTKHFLHVIEDFKPDVIHIFGTESELAEILELTDVPLVIHIQGLINPITNAYFPAGYSGMDFLTNTRFFFQNILGSSPHFTVKHFKSRSEREKNILKKARYVMGRTEWDKNITRLFNNDIQYFHVDEVLRPPFYDAALRRLKNIPKTFTIVSTLSGTTYKGMDVVLKTADLLNKLTDINFNWKIIGVAENDPILNYFEKSLGIDHKQTNINCCGFKTAEEMITLLQESSVYVHPTYIDNSPNSVCEAQMLGLPTIVCRVGGLESLIEDSVNGILVPSNGVFEMVHAIIKLQTNKEFYRSLAKNAYDTAVKRHDKEQIIESLLNAYQTMRE